MLLFFLANMNTFQINKIKKVNKLLIKKFGIPHRNKKLPDSVDMIIATILSQNTNDNNSYKAYQNLRQRFKNWNELLKVKRTTIEKEIRVAGLGKQKSKAIKDLVTALDKNNGKISLKYIKKMNDENAIAELTSFNGIGVKTASCVLLFAEDRNVCPVDTHVHRTLNRIGIMKASTPDKTFIQLNNNFPANIAHQFHTNLIRLGREICKSQNPACGSCPVNKLCDFENKTEISIKDSKQRDFMLLDNVN